MLGRGEDGGDKGRDATFEKRVRDGRRCIDLRWWLINFCENVGGNGEG